MKRILTGIQPTNDLTIGNYLGAIKQVVDLQEHTDLILFVADLHTITTGFVDPQKMRNNRRQIVRTYLAAGVNPQNVTLFYQSDVWAHTMLEHLFICNTTLGELKRMTQYKSKVAQVLKQSNQTEMIPTGLLIYPALMAADILLYDADLVPVGNDQKQHLELTRNIAERFNNRLGTSVFKLPDPMIPKVGARIMDLQDPSVKMSKSAPNPKGVIFLNDPIPDSLKKIQVAVTDNLNQVKYDPERQPGISNLINLYSALTGKEIQEVEAEFQGVPNYGVFKKAIQTVLEAFLTNFQAKFKAIDEQTIDAITQAGAQKAREIADPKLEIIMKAMGY